MRFISFQDRDKQSWGALIDGQVHDLSHLAPSLLQAIAASLLPLSPAQLDGKGKTLAYDELLLLSPVPTPKRILCVGQNYAAHRDEMGGASTARPLIFTRYPDSVVGHGRPLIKPPESEQFDYEGELAVIIGKSGRRIAADKAMQHIAGYSCFMDGSIRDFQRHTTQYIPGKNFEQSGACGPWMLSADEVPEPGCGLRLQTRLNGEVVQDTTTDLMLFDIPTTIAYLSIFTTLEAGDIIATGTPGGVGYKREPQLFMQAGDCIEVEVESIATLRNTISE